MTDLAVCNNIFVDFDSHNVKEDNGIFKFFYSKDLSNFKLIRIADIYSEIEEGKLNTEALVFLDGQGREIKVKSISKEPYSGRIYDVTVPNHIILVKRGDLIVWSGNSYNNFTSLSEGSHTFKAYAQDVGGNVNQTETRTVTIDITPPGINFTSPTPANGTTQSQTYVTINVSITESSLGEVKYNWNGTNYTFYNDSLVLMMNFDNRSALGEQTSGSGNKTVDISRYGNNGSFYGDATINLSGGRYSGGLQLDGDGDYVDCGNDASLNFTVNDFTISAWIMSSSNSSEQLIAEKEGITTPIGWRLNMEGTNKGQIRLFLRNGGSYIYSQTSGYYNDGKWYHVVGVANRTGNKLDIYINGSETSYSTDSSVTGGFSSSTNISTVNPFRLGLRIDDNAQKFNGTIDNVMIFNRSLSASEIQQLYFANLQKYNQTQWYLYVNQSKNSTTGLDNGIYTYSASAKDILGNENTTEIKTITIDTISPYYNTTEWVARGLNQTQTTFYFNLTWKDDLSNISHWIVSENQSGAWYNHTANTTWVNKDDKWYIAVMSFLITAAKNTYFSVIGYANDAANNWNNTGIIVNVTVLNSAPDVSLVAPPNNSVSGINTILFEYNVTDIDNDNIDNCSLIINNGILQTNTTITRNITQNFTATLISGFYRWAINCTDEDGAVGSSEAREIRFLNVTDPDLEVNSLNIVFSNNDPVETENVVINATIYNIGNENATDVVVQFFEDYPNNIQIGGNISINLSIGKNSTVNVTWQAKVGLYNITVIVDPPLATNGSITELNESNNIANKTIFVSAYHTYYGKIGVDINLDSILNISVYAWLNQTDIGGNVFVIDSDSSITWTNLTALGTNTSGNKSIDDFEEIDIALNLTNLTDSINLSYTYNGNPKNIDSFLVYDSNITNVPIVNSTNNSNFITGILWDSSDINNGEYNGTQDVVFITKINNNAQGKYGVYDYEIKIPANLRRYIIPNDENSVTLYTELR